MTRPFQRVALGGLVVACLLAAAAHAEAFLPGGATVGSAITLAFATALLMASLIVLGGGGRGGIGALAAAGGTIVVVVGGGVAGAFLVGAPAGPDAGLVGGLPAGVALLVYGAGVVPAVIVPLVYAWTFDRTTLPPEVLDEVRRRGAAFRATDPDAPGEA